MTDEDYGLEFDDNVTSLKKLPGLTTSALDDKSFQNKLKRRSKHTRNSTQKISWQDRGAVANDPYEFNMRADTTNLDDMMSQGSYMVKLPNVKNGPGDDMTSEGSYMVKVDDGSSQGTYFGKASDL